MINSKDVKAFKGITRLLNTHDVVVALIFDLWNA